MSYQKIKVCRSTQVAFNILGMLKSNTMNKVRSFVDDDLPWCQYEEENGYIPVDQDEPKPFDNDKLEFISSLLSRHQEQEIRIHDVEESGHWYERHEDRRVQFFFNGPRHRKVIVTVNVARIYLDGDEVSGFTAWQMKEVTIQTFDDVSHQFRLRPLHMRMRDTQWILSPEMKENVGHPVFFMKF